jgi:hypothetical protein
MKKYLVRFTTKGGDHDKEWCHAMGPAEAMAIIQSDHWNIAYIESVEEL